MCRNPENNASAARSVTMQLTIRWSPPAWHFDFSAAAARLDRLRCALLGGHDDELVVDERVIALRCRRCSWRSPGWQLDSPRSRNPCDRAGMPTEHRLSRSHCGHEHQCNQEPVERAVRETCGRLLPASCARRAWCAFWRVDQLRTGLRLRRWVRVRRGATRQRCLNCV